MTARTILQLGNPVLWLASERVELPMEATTRQVIEDLDDTLAQFRATHGFGRGIAAPQIGVSKRVLFVRMGQGGFEGPLINPEIVWQSPERMELWDDCFSLPGLMVKLTRARRIRVSYVDGEGVHRELDAEQDLSELLQHEIDHLEGILATDRAASPRAFATRDEWSRRSAESSSPGGTRPGLQRSG